VRSRCTRAIILSLAITGRIGIAIMTSKDAIVTLDVMMSGSVFPLSVNSDQVKMGIFHA